MQYIKVNDLRVEGFTRIHCLTKEIDDIATALESLDQTVMSASERDIDETRSLIAAVERLAALLGTAVAV